MSNIIKNEFDVFAFRAVDEPELCQAYLKGHRKVLMDYGIENITSSKPVWMQNPNIFCLGLKDKLTNELLGGIRIQIADGTNPLPVEEAIGYMDKKIYDTVNYFHKNGGVGELCGLWIDNRLRGYGFGWYMVRAAIATTSQLNFKTLVGICGHVTLNMFNSVGFQIDKSIGNEGTFLYPNKDLIAYTVGILDSISLSTAKDYDKSIMMSLREEPKQIRIENDTKIISSVNYNLVFPKV